MRVLSVTHGPSVPGGVFDEAVEAAGHVLERWQVPDGGSPDPARSYDAVMVFGGSQHPDQDDRFGWLGHEEEFLREVLAEEVPVFGVCLGAQMLARAAGASVGPAREPEIGWLDVALTAEGAGDPVLGVLPARATVFQWHHYTFSLPPGGTALAESAICLQAFRLDGRPAWGIQFHAEVTRAMVAAWVEEDPDDLPMPADELTRRVGRADGAVERAGPSARRRVPPRGRRALAGVVRHRARPLVPRADVVARVVSGTLEHLRREPRAAPDVAVRDDLGAFGQADEVAHLDRAPALEDALEREVHGARDVALARIAVRAGCALELERRPHVDEGDASPATSPRSSSSVTSSTGSRTRAAPR